MPNIVVPGLEGLDGGALHAAQRNPCASSSCCASIIIIGREIAISALREWMAEIGKRGKVKVSQLAKYKTILQIVGLSCMLFRWNLPIVPGITLPIFEIGLVLTVVAAVLTLHLGDLLPARGLAGSARHDMTQLGLRVLRLRARRAA